MKKQNLNKVKIYSIESRKGGVGKTTIALNLANVLRNKGSLVLVLDFDFLGTSMGEAIKSSQYWSKQNIRIVQEKKNKKSEESEDVNLVDLLNPCTQQSLKSLIRVSSNAKRLPITVISSKFPTKDADNLNLLLDELHVFGYLYLLETIIQQFVALNPGHEHYSIVIDHSPGNSSLHKEMNEWIIKNYSVDNAKFVLVSSFDPQDFSACIETASEIKGFVDKIVQFNSTIKEALFQESLEDIDRSLYYDILDEQVCVPQKETKASAFLALILNKVPTEVLNSELSLDYELGEDSKNQLFNEIALYSTDTQSPKNMILYDKTIGLQYMTKRIQPVFKGDVLGVINDSFLEFIQEVNNISVVDVPILKDMADKYKRICDILVKNHYKRYANVLLKNEKLTPSFPLLMIESTIRNLVSLTFTMGRNGLASVKNIDNFKQSTAQLEQFIADLKIPNLSVSLVSAWQYLFVVANYKHKGTEPLVSALALMLHIFMVVQQNRYGSSKNYRDFLAKEYSIDFNNQEWNTFLESIISGITNCNEIDKLCKAVIPQFNMFYRNLCYFLLRLIDLKIDIQFILINTLQTIQQGNVIPPHNLSRYFEIAVMEKQNALITEIRLRKELMRSEMFTIESVLKDNVLKNFILE